jgi:K+ transporter
MEPHFSPVAVVAFAAFFAIGVIHLLRRYPDGFVGTDGNPSFAVNFMVASALGAGSSFLFFGLVLAGAITFQ